MRRASKALVAVAVIALAAWIFASNRSIVAGDDSQPRIETPSDIVDQIMGLIGTNRIDDAIARNDFLKNTPDARETARGSLIHLRDELGTYRGYDIVAIHRFSPRLQTIHVLAYYDQQPIVLDFGFYNATGHDNGPWTIPFFHIASNAPEELKDVPMDYPGHK
jgi:hypothetical protein